MADEEQIIKLCRGVDAWNEWREKNPDSEVDLYGANLEGLDLSTANLKGAKLYDANLKGARLIFANLEGAMPYNANLEGADLTDSNLKGADLTFANLKGANLTHTNMDGAVLFGANLKGAVLSDSSLKEAYLNFANLKGAKGTPVYLQGADLDMANLGRANLGGSNLQGANLIRAKLQGANLSSANLSGVVLTYANLKKACLSGANLSGAELAHANLNKTDLSKVYNLRLNSTYLKDAHFSPRSSDPWSILRRTYTGPKVMFQLLVLIAFVLPYIGKIAFWSFVNRGQGYTQGLLETIRQRAHDHGIDEQAINAIGLSQDRITPLSMCLSEACEQRSAWQLLLGADQHALFWLLSITLIVYNVLRGLLTCLVVPMREEEERSGYSPIWSPNDQMFQPMKWWQGYRALYYGHKLVSWLGIVALAAFLYNAGYWLLQPIYVPI